MPDDQVEARAEHASDYLHRTIRKNHSLMKTPDPTQNFG